MGEVDSLDREIFSFGDVGRGHRKYRRRRARQGRSKAAAVRLMPRVSQRSTPATRR